MPIELGITAAGVAMTSGGWLMARESASTMLGLMSAYGEMRLKSILGEETEKMHDVVVGLAAACA